MLVLHSKNMSAENWNYKIYWRYEFMKKLLLVLLALGVIFSCGKKEEKTETGAESSGTAVESNVPKFKDPDVQELANAYAELSKEYDNLTPEKSGELTKKFQDISAKAQETSAKLASDPKEAEKLAKYMQEVGTEIQEKMTKKQFKQNMGVFCKGKSIRYIG